MLQRYMVIHEINPPFFTDWFSEEMMPDDRPTVVVDNIKGLYTRNGVDWFEMETDHL